MPNVPDVRSTDRSRPARRDVAWRVAERGAWIVALAMLAGSGVLWITDRAAAQSEIDRFVAVTKATPVPAGDPDFQLWSPGRIRAWRDAAATPTAPPLGILRMKRLRVEAAILEGTDDRTLNRAVGHIDGTALPGTAGNVGLAGHRDSFFRALKDVAIGDTVEMTTPAGTVIYRVEHTSIVAPTDVSVLGPTPSPAVTLVTCYPFYFVGSAPQRFIVRAVRSPMSTMRADPSRSPDFAAHTRDVDQRARDW